jgi:prepilin-type N-terminal cleavage/methylation domain-containing protein
MHRTDGFSLVEVMCAILILGVGLVGLSQGITTALSSNKESEVQTAAALIAAGRIETLRAEGYLQEGVQEGEVGLYRWRESVASSTIEGLYEVAVVVENAKTGRALYELRTLLFEAPGYSAAGEPASQKNPSKASTRRGASR